MKSISVEGLKTRIKEQDIVVLDVREPWELKIAKISKSIILFPILETNIFGPL